MDIIDVALRLIVAAMIGVALGLNRDLHGKPTGVRTLGLVALGAATVVLGVGRGVGADSSRVVQGIVTGIGFIGAGVIVRSDQPEVVHGLTTAACVWLTACAGAVCGAGHSVGRSTCGACADLWRLPGADLASSLASPRDN